MSKSVSHNCPHFAWNTVGVLQIVLLGGCNYSPLKKYHTNINISRAVDVVGKNLESGHQEDFKTVFKIFVWCLQPYIHWCLYYVCWERRIIAPACAHFAWNRSLADSFAGRMQLFISQKTSYKHQCISSCRRCRKNFRIRT